MSIGLILDIILLAILVFTAYTYMKSGFLSSLTRLVGNIVSLLGASFVASKLSPTVFESFFKSGLITKTGDAISAQGSFYIEPLIEKLRGFLPAEFINELAAKANELLSTGSPDLARDIVEQIIAPLMVPIISVLVFFITFAVCRFIVAQLSAILTNVNKVPILGGVNKLLGLTTGVVGGIIEIVLVLCAIWALVVITGGSLSMLNDTVLQGSKLYSLFSVYNPFL
ncbi:MAG: CvpA family protein [Oscillospiraceae bacterium]